MLRLLSSFLNRESYLYKNYASYDGKLFYKGYEIAFIYEGKILMRDDIHYFPIEFLLIYKFGQCFYHFQVRHHKFQY